MSARSLSIMGAGIVLAANIAVAGPERSSCALAAIFPPDSPFATVQDFEIAVDPEDPEGNLIFAANVERGAPQGTAIYVMRLDGRTGMISGVPRIVADNYTGIQRVNGPELAYHPDHGLGVMLAGPGGIHAAWRAPGAAWDAFDVDLEGARFPPLAPPALPPTIPGRHPKDSQTFGFRTYAEIDFETDTCSEVCYAYLSDRTTTDLKRVLEAGSTFRMYRSTLHPLADGYAIVTGCRVPTLTPADCGLFEVKIDGNGGIQAGTFMQLAALEQFADKAYLQMAAGVRPQTEHLVVGVIFGLTITVWEAAVPHAPLEKVGTVAIPPGGKDNPNHLRFVPGASTIYIHFFVRDGANMGSYVSLLDDTLHPSVRIDPADPGGSELVYLPAAGRFAEYRSETVTLPGGTIATAIQRCWIDRQQSGQ